MTSELLIIVALQTELRGQKETQALFPSLKVTFGVNSWSLIADQSRWKPGARYVINQHQTGVSVADSRPPTFCTKYVQLSARDQTSGA